MGKRGPQPQPAELKKLRGNPGKRAVKETASSTPMVPECPGSLKSVKATWDHYGQILAKMGILQESDGVSWELLWRTWADYLYACNDPECTMSNKLQLANTVQRLLDHFGMSPSARGSIAIDPPKEESEFEQFLNRNKIAK